MPERRRRGAWAVWWMCAALLVGPSLVVLGTRAVAFALGCAPGAALCRTALMGTVLRESFGLAWIVGLHPLRALALAAVAAVAALLRRKPLLASLGTLFLPLIAVAGPAIAVRTLLFPGCSAAETSGCTIFGASLGAAVHRASLAPSVIYGAAPYDCALALMIAVIGFAFFRAPKRASGSHAAQAYFHSTAKSFHDPRE